MKLPTVVLGFVQGPVRWEMCGGTDVTRGRNKLLVFEPPFYYEAADEYFAVTHLQKYSRFGFLLMSHEKWWQLCFHVWLTLAFQHKRLSDGDVVVDVPGTETVPYWRVGWSRWDAGDCKYVKGYVVNVQLFSRWRFTFRIPFGTWFGPGLHWD